MPQRGPVPDRRAGCAAGAEVSRERTIALSVLAVGSVLLFTSHNRNLTLLVALICFVALGWLIAGTALDARDRRRQRKREEELRQVPWKMFSEPTDVKGQRRIGVRRTAQDGTVLERDLANDVLVNDGDPFAKLDAQGEAMSRAVEYNEGRGWP